MTDKTVILLYYEPGVLGLSEAARFCLHTAKLKAVENPDIWIICADKKRISDRDREMISDILSVYFANFRLHVFSLETTLWRHSSANNALTLPAIAAYQALKSIPDGTDIFAPLNQGLTYFLMHAALGGLSGSNHQFHITCYLPRSLAAPGMLRLPLDLQDVVSEAMERWIAQTADTLTVTHPNLIPEIAERLTIPSDRISALSQGDRKGPFSDISDPTHLIFAGDPTPLYGFDAFCDLADAITNMDHADSSLGQVTLAINPAHDDLSLLKPARTRLRNLSWTHNVQVNWVTNEDLDWQTLPPGILICPMRAPCWPLAAQTARIAGYPVIWGTGFSQKDRPQNIEPGVIKTVSDFRPLLRLLTENEHTPSPEAAAPSLAKPHPKPKSRLRKAPSVSVILVHKDRPQYVRRTLLSLARQSLGDFEIIIVDDGSAAEALAQLRHHIKEAGVKNAHIHPIHNSYPAEARNQGADIATGEALFFIDDDNILAPETLKAFQMALRRVDIAFSFFQSFHNDTEPERLAPNPDGGPEIRGPSYGFIGPHAGVGLFHNMVGNSSLMIRRETFERLGGFTPLYGVGLEDYAFVMRCVNERFVVLPEPYLHFREHAQKIRRHHVDWRAPTRLQAGDWRIVQEMGEAQLPPIARAYARQLHALTQYQYVPRNRPKFFRLRSVFLHHYVRPFMARRLWLRRGFLRWQGRQSPLYKRMRRFIKAIFT